MSNEATQVGGKVSQVRAAARLSAERAEFAAAVSDVAANVAANVATVRAALPQLSKVPGARRAW